MRYMMLIHHDDAALSAADQKALWADYAAFNEALSKAEGASSGERLESAAGGTIVRNNDVLDGPYADTKEQFAGYFFVEAADLVYDRSIIYETRDPVGDIEIVECEDICLPWPITEQERGRREQL